MNTCDHDHQGDFETRLLPYGGGGNIIVCYDHYLSELRFRAERNKELGKDNQFDLPTWKSLKVYPEVEQ